jgi:putative transcriptional regulator
MEKIRVWRVIKRVSQYELSNMTGIAQSKISLFENGHAYPKLEELKRIAKALGVNESDFFSIEN